MKNPPTAFVALVIPSESESVPPVRLTISDWTALGLAMEMSAPVEVPGEPGAEYATPLVEETAAKVALPRST